MRPVRWLLPLFVVTQLSVHFFGQTVADAARKARQNATGNSKVTISNDTIHPTGRGAAATTTATTSGKTAVTSAATGAKAVLLAPKPITDNKGRDEK